MLVIAHRGYHASEPENTLAAFEAAIALGVDGIETDIRLSSDGQLVLYHDRLAPDGRRVSDVTRQELERQAGHAVPTLDQALERFPQPLRLLEIKAPEALDRTLEITGKYAGARRLMIISFWHNVVQAALEQSENDCGMLICHRPSHAPPTLGDGTAHRRSVAIVWNYEFMDFAGLELVSAEGRRSFVYGVETEHEHAECRRLGLDGVITDHPHYLL